jgi:hypothetical protein
MDEDEQIKGMANRNIGSLGFLGVQEARPPQRPWVGIPEEDLKQGDESFYVAWREGARWAEAYLKERNSLQ